MCVFVCVCVCVKNKHVTSTELHAGFTADRVYTCLHHLYVALPLPIVNYFQVDAGSATKKMKTEIPSAKKTSNLVAQAFGSDVCSLCFIMQQCITCLEMS